MRLFDWFWRRQSRSAPKSAQKLEAPPVTLTNEGASALVSTQFLESKQFGEEVQFREEMHKLHIYLRERGIVYELENEAPFAVLWPTQSANATLLGEQLRAWAVSNRGVKRILGLERLLEGRCPEVSATVLTIFFSPSEPESCIESVALVTVERGTNTEELWASLCNLAEGSGGAMVMSFWKYNCLDGCEEKRKAAVVAVVMSYWDYSNMNR